MIRKMIRSPVAERVLRTSLKDNDKKMIRKMIRSPVAERVLRISLKDKDKEIIRKRPTVKCLF
jgi:protein-tyrosine-phosphatase